MSSPPPLYIGMVAPYVVRVRVAASPGFDPVVAATASAISLEVQKPNGAFESWPATVESSAADAITVSHTFAVGDLDRRGSYSCFARFALASGGVLRSVVGKLPTVLDPNQVSP